MADPDTKLSVLVDPPLADPPPVAELQRRARAWRRRTAAGRGGLAMVVAVVAVGVGLAVTSGERSQILQTAGPSGAVDGAAPASSALPPAREESVTRPTGTFQVDGQTWTMLATRSSDPAICITLRPAVGEATPPGCVTPDGRAIQAAAFDLKSVSFVYGIVALDVTSVTLAADGNGSRIDVVGAGAGFPVNFIGTVVPPSATTAELTATRNGNEERVSVPLPSHLRVSAVNGRSSPPVPPAAPSATQPSTTLAPDTPVSTVVPPTTPRATTPPSGGQAKRVEPVPGATGLQRHAFESTAPVGPQSLAVRFWNGVEPCSVLGRVDVAETADRVTITLWTGAGPGAAGATCIALAGYYEVIVQLQAPLGARTVVDGAK